MLQILEDAGLGLPEYYKWRSRSGCYFCFFQRKDEWAGLLERHPDLFEEAKKYEKVDPETEERYTWAPGESLEEIAKPERLLQIRKKSQERRAAVPKSNALYNILEDDDDDKACLICSL